MRIHTAIAALALVATALLQTPSAQSETRARLRLFVVDETHAAVPGATVTIFTLDGKLGTSVTADDKGVAVFPDLPVGLSEIYARTSGYTPYIEAARLRAGANDQTATLHSRRQESGSTQSETSSASS